MTAIVESATALQVDGISAGYGQTTILRDINLSVPAGSIVALLGPNGAGKTTLLNTISGLVHPTHGSIHLDGTDVTRLAPNRRATLGLCHIPEGRGIFRSLSVKENIELQVKSGEESNAIERAITAFPILGQRLAQRAGSLSGGQQQMLAMARAYTRNPSLILVDEASLGLAPIVVDDIFKFLANVTTQGASLLIVDQFVARALSMSTQAYVLNRGEIVFSGTSAELQNNDVFQRYLGDS